MTNLPAKLIIISMILIPILGRFKVLSLLVFGVLLFDIFISSKTIDFSPDGNSYHFRAIEIIHRRENLFFGAFDDPRLSGTPVLPWVFPAIYRALLDVDHINSGGKLVAAIPLSLLCWDTVSKLWEKHGLRNNGWSAQAVIAMLACGRIGAIHSVVFGGFASNELASRIDDSKAKILVTASCGFEPGRTVEYKPLVDEAVKLASHKISKMILFQIKGHCL